MTKFKTYCNLKHCTKKFGSNSPPIIHVFQTTNWLLPVIFVFPSSDPTSSFYISMILSPPDLSAPQIPSRPGCSQQESHRHRSPWLRSPTPSQPSPSFPPLMPSPCPQWARCPSSGAECAPVASPLSSRMRPSGPPPPSPPSAQPPPTARSSTSPWTSPTLPTSPHPTPRRGSIS